MYSQILFHAQVLQRVSFFWKQFFLNQSIIQSFVFQLSDYKKNDTSYCTGNWVLPIIHLKQKWGLPLWLSWKRICLQCGRPGFDPWVGKIPWRRKRLPTPRFWPREFHGPYSPWGCKELDRTEQPSLSLSKQIRSFSFKRELIPSTILDISQFYYLLCPCTKYTISSHTYFVRMTIKKEGINMLGLISPDAKINKKKSHYMHPKKKKSISAHIRTFYQRQMQISPRQ